MKRKIILIMLLALSVIGISANAETAVKSTQKFEINAVQSNISGYNIGGYNYFRLRDLQSELYKYGMIFSLEGDSETIRIGVNSPQAVQSDRITLKNRVNALKKNIGVISVYNDKTLEVYNIDGYNYFKLRDLADFIEISVGYDPITDTASISTDFVNSLLVPNPPTIPDEQPQTAPRSSDRVVLGNERLIEEYSYLIDGKRVGLITNQTGVNSKLEPTGAVLKAYEGATLAAIYSPEHGYDGLAPAGEYVESYFHEGLGLNVYSLYGKTRKPTPEMLRGVEVLVFDMQDIGSRTYTYMSTLNYAMRAAAENSIPIVVLDRPNPLGGRTVEGFVLEEKFASFVGVDEMPMAHGMTAGELAKFFNRKIGALLTVVEMKNYTRDMIWQDTGLAFVQTSPNIPDIESAFNYMATGIGDGTGFGQSDKFKFGGAAGLDAQKFTDVMNSYGLPGVRFVPATRGSRSGAELVITDYHTYNPQLTGTYMIATANLITELKAPMVEGGKVPMFTKISGTERMAQALRAKMTPEQIVTSYQAELNSFMREREKYLIYK